tara:strand:- start:3291 stop:5237 length:1947 start_codon:yes stop_codon:yes gene_type:complete
MNKDIDMFDIIIDEIELKQKGGVLTPTIKDGYVTVKEKSFLDTFDDEVRDGVDGILERLKLNEQTKKDLKATGEFVEGIGKGLFKGGIVNPLDLVLPDDSVFMQQAREAVKYDPEYTFNNFGYEASKFFGSFLGLGKLLAIGKLGSQTAKLGTFGQDALRSLASTFTAYEATDENLADAIIAMGADPEDFPVLQQLMTNPDDSEFEGRLKNVLADLPIEALIPTISTVIKSIKKGDSTTINENTQKLEKEIKELLDKQSVGSAINPKGELAQSIIEEADISTNVSKQAPTEIDSLKIMSSDDFKIPSKGPQVKLNDILEYYDKQPKLDITNPDDFSKMVNQAAEEVKYQLDQDVNGIGWYDIKLKNAMTNLESYNPVFKTNPENKDFVIVLTSIMSPGFNVGKDFRAALKVTDNFLKTNNVPNINPDTGKGFGRFPASKDQLEFIDAFIKNKSLNDFLKFIHTPTTRREVNAFREKIGFKKISGPLDKEIVGADVFGPKVSKFMQNLLGISDENVPDVWFTRGFNRKRGTMFNEAKTGNRETIDAPRTLEERQLMDKYIEDTRNQLKTKYNIELNNRDTQAVLWYFEQGLYTKLGVRSTPEDYETITKQLINEKTNDSQGSISPSATSKIKNQRTTAEPITTGEIPDG